MASSLGKMPTTSVRRLISPLRRSSGLVRVQLGAVLRREGHVGQHVGLGLVHEGGELGHLGPELVGDRCATARLAASASSWAKAVAMKAETTRRPLLPAWASALRMKWTRQRCQVALSTLATAALMPSWASETTSLTPRRPRRVSLRRNSVQNGLGLGGADVHAEHLAPAVAVDADRDDHGDRDDAAVLAHLHVGGVDPQVGPVALDRPVEEGLHLARRSPRTAG